MNCEKEIPIYCQGQFDEINERLKDGNRHFGEHDKEIATLSADM